MMDEDTADGGTDGSVVADADPADGAVASAELMAKFWFTALLNTYLDVCEYFSRVCGEFDIWYLKNLTSSIKQKVW